jgi:hypothetical protein
MRKIQGISVALLLVLFFAFVILGVFQSQNDPPQPASTSTMLNDKGFEVNIPQKALVKNTVTVSVKARPGTICILTYIPPSGETSIMDTTADTKGVCSWRWNVEESKGKGSSRLIFTIDGISETHFMEVWSGF